MLDCHKIQSQSCEWLQQVKYVSSLTTATHTRSWRIISTTSESEPTSSGLSTFHFSCGPGKVTFAKAATMLCPTRALSRSTSHASRFPVRFAELTSAPQYLRSQEKLVSRQRMSRHSIYAASAATCRIIPSGHMRNENPALCTTSGCD